MKLQDITTHYAERVKNNYYYSLLVEYIYLSFDKRDVKKHIKRWKLTLFIY